MKISKLFLIAILVIAVMTSATAVFAAPGHPPPGGPTARPPRLTGEVAAIADGSLTLVTLDEVEVVVNTDERTKVRIMETHTEGSLEDIVIGDFIHVGGKKQADDSVDARVITILPDGDRIGGKVTGVEGGVITVENRDKETLIIVTDSETVFRAGEDEITIDDIEEGMRLSAFGELQDDGSLDAELVLVAPEKPERPSSDAPGRPGRPGGPGGRG